MALEGEEKVIKNYSSETGKEIPLPGAEPLKEETTDPVKEESKTGTPEKEEPKKEENKPVVEEPKVQIVDWKKISADAGYELKSEADVVPHLKAKRELEEKVRNLSVKATAYESIDPFALDIDRAKKAGLSTDLYLEARNLDVESKDGKELLWRKYRLENPDESEKSAKLLFEDEYESKYGILNQKFDEQELVDNTKKMELAKARLESDVNKSKKYLTDWKSKHVTIPEVKPEVEQQRHQEVRESYMTKADEFLQTAGEMTIPVGDLEFKYGMTDHLKDIEGDVKNPIETLKTWGIDLEKQVIDPELFGEICAKIRILDHIGKPLADWHLEQSNAQTVKSKLEQPTLTKTPAGKEPGEKSHDERVAEAFEADRRRREQGR